MQVPIIPKVLTLSTYLDHFNGNLFLLVLVVR